MSDPQYWGSLHKAGVFIYLSLFLMFLGLGAFIFLYDRISEYPIWNSPIWLKVKVPLIVLGVAGLLGSIIAYAVYEGKMELKLAQGYSETKGWQFSQDDTDGLKPLVAAILDDLKFDVYYIRTLSSGPSGVFLFDCSYMAKNSGSRQRYSRGTACYVRSERLPSSMTPIKVITRDWTEVMI